MFNYVQQRAYVLGGEDDLVRYRIEVSGQFLVLADLRVGEGPLIVG